MDHVDEITLGGFCEDLHDLNVNKDAEKLGCVVNVVYTRIIILHQRYTL